MGALAEEAAFSLLVPLNLIFLFKYLLHVVFDSNNMFYVFSFYRFKFCLMKLSLKSCESLFYVYSHVVLLGAGSPDSTVLIAGTPTIRATLIPLRRLVARFVVISSCFSSQSCSFIQMEIECICQLLYFCITY